MPTLLFLLEILRFVIISSITQLSFKNALLVNTLLVNALLINALLINALFVKLFYI
jgi:hypothetical protein